MFSFNFLPTDLVKGFSGDLSDSVIREINNFKHLVVVPQSEDVPIQTGYVIAIEDQDLGVVWKQLKNIGV